MTPSGKHTARVIEAIALLVKLPRTTAELMDTMGVTSKDQVPRYIRALRDEGLVYISEWRMRGNNLPVAVYAWQPSVLQNEDAPRPVAKGFGRRVTMRQAMDGQRFCGPMDIGYRPRRGAKAERVLKYMRKEPGPFTVGQLAEVFATTSPNMDSVLRYPVRHGLIKRDASRRPALYSLTEAA